jgi:hypothetical protein
MTTQAQNQPDKPIITLEAEDGKTYACQVLDIVQFESNEYALLLKISAGQRRRWGRSRRQEKREALVIMQLTQRDGEYSFRTISSAEEFERVVAHVKAQRALYDEDEACSAEYYSTVE